jgi:AraC family transcriptional regulator of adaptative response / DNA-3-methyladenine glycosylase II
LESENSQQYRTYFVIILTIMIPDHQLCYAAIKSRDARFDGHFFTAVLTTGIYCRPICPAITPRSENVRFFISASGAEAAGFRPCLRCRPEASPGMPDWQAPSEIVSRALRLISEGFLDQAGIAALARRLHIGTRHLSRLFIKQLGAPPSAIAQTRRIHFAKQLIDETNLPMSEIAFCAGFSSIRRFNAAMRGAYDRSPTELRRVENSGHSGLNELNLQLKLSYRPPFDWTALLEFLRNRAIPGVELVEKDQYRRTVKIEDVVGIIEVRFIEGQQHVLLSVPPYLSRSLMKIAERMRTLFDLRADPLVITNHLRQDEKMAGLVQAYPGLRLPGAWDGFEIAVRAILGQQVSIKAANTLAGRLVKAYGDPFQIGEDVGLAYLFPGPERLAEASLSEIGLMPGRAEAIRTLARAVLDGKLVFSTAIRLEEIIECLTALPGLGPWTAHYIAMRAFSEPDAFPAGDLGLRRAAAETETAMLTESQLRQRAEAWRPWRAYAAIYLWQHYSSFKKEGRK